MPGGKLPICYFIFRFGFLVGLGWVNDLMPTASQARDVMLTTDSLVSLQLRYFQHHRLLREVGIFFGVVHYYGYGITNLCAHFYLLVVDYLLDDVSIISERFDICQGFGETSFGGRLNSGDGHSDCDGCLAVFGLGRG